MGKHPVRQEITRLKYGKFQGRRSVEEVEAEAGDRPGSSADTRGRASTSSQRGTATDKPQPETAIDVLYENQRGMILCGMKLFSSKALGGLDPPAWTNIAGKPSATDITNAQPPDPSWEWVWKDWTINHDDGVDDEGWRYAFAFGKPFSWHGPSWYNSCVRRRAWIRKRAKKGDGYRLELQNSDMLSPQYFSVHPSRSQSRSRPSSSDGNPRASGNSLTQSSRYEAEEIEIPADISTITQLMAKLRISRIDREKMEAVENFCAHGGDELKFLKDNMSDIIHQFVFQASRRLLLTHLTNILGDLDAEEKAEKGKESSQLPATRERIRYLEEAVHAADEAIKKLDVDFRSDDKFAAVEVSEGFGDDFTRRATSGKEDAVTNEREYSREPSPDSKGIDKGKGKDD